MQPKISIIVPVYKVENYLCRCVDSILAQTYTDFELLLINDGSPDNSGVICDEYAQKDNRVRVFRKENGGVSSARNLGLEKAQGEWIAFCDSDDYVTSNWLASFEIAINEKLDFAIQGRYHIDDRKKEPKNILSQTGDTIDSKRKLIIDITNQDVFGYLGDKFFRKDIIDKYHISFDEKIALWEDGVFIAKYLEYATSFACINNLGYCYILPPINKRYNGTAYRSVFLMLKSFEIIYKKEIPNELIKPYFNIFKDYMVISIVNDNTIEPEYFDLYSYIIKKGFGNCLVNFLITHSRKNALAAKLLKNIHRLLTFKSKILSR